MAGGAYIARFAMYAINETRGIRLSFPRKRESIAERVATARILCRGLLLVRRQFAHMPDKGMYVLPAEYCIELFYKKSWGVQDGTEIGCRNSIPARPSKRDPAGPTHATRLAMERRSIRSAIIVTPWPETRPALVRTLAPWLERSIVEARWCTRLRSESTQIATGILR